MLPLSRWLQDGSDDHEKGFEEEELDIDAFFLPGGILDPDNFQNEGELHLPGIADNLSPSMAASLGRHHEPHQEHQPLYSSGGRQRSTVEAAQSMVSDSTETVNVIADDADPPPGFVVPPPPPGLPTMPQVRVNFGDLEMERNHTFSETTLLNLSQQGCQLPRDDDDEHSRPMNVVTFQTGTTSRSTTESSISRTLDSPSTTSNEVSGESPSATNSIDEGPGLNPKAAIFTPIQCRSSPRDEVLRENESSSENLSDASSKFCSSNDFNSLQCASEACQIIDDDNNVAEPTPMTERKLDIAESYQCPKISHRLKDLLSICLIGPYRSAEGAVVKHCYPSLLLFSHKTLRCYRQLLQHFIMVAFLVFHIIAAVLSNAVLACFSTNIIFKRFPISFYAPSKTAYIYTVFLLTPSICDILMHCFTLPHFSPHILSSLALCSCVHPLNQDKTKVPGRLSFLILTKLRWVILYILYNEGFEKPNISPMVNDGPSRVALAFCLAVLHDSLVLSPLAWVTLSLHHLSVSLLGSSQTLGWILGIVSLAALQTSKTLPSRN